MFDEGHRFGRVRHGEQQKETSTSPPLHNPSRKDPDRAGTRGAPAERKKRQNQSLPRPPPSGTARRNITFDKQVNFEHAVPGDPSL